MSVHVTRAGRFVEVLGVVHKRAGRILGTSGNLGEHWARCALCQARLRRVPGSLWKIPLEGSGRFHRTVERFDPFALPSGNVGILTVVSFPAQAPPHERQLRLFLSKLSALFLHQMRHSDEFGSRFSVTAVMVAGAFVVNCVQRNSL